MLLGGHDAGSYSVTSPLVNHHSIPGVPYSQAKYKFNHMLLYPSLWLFLPGLNRHFHHNLFPLHLTSDISMGFNSMTVCLRFCNPHYSYHASLRDQRPSFSLEYRGHHLLAISSWEHQHLACLTQTLWLARCRIGKGSRGIIDPLPLQNLTTRAAPAKCACTLLSSPSPVHLCMCISLRERGQRSKLCV